MLNAINLLRSELVRVERAWRDDAELWLLRKRGRDVVEHLEAVDRLSAPPCGGAARPGRAGACERALDFEARDVRRAAHEASSAAFALVHLLDAANLPDDARTRARLAITCVLDALAPYLGRADTVLRRVLLDGADVEDALRAQR